MNYEETIKYLYAYLPMFQYVGSKALKKDLNNTVQLVNHLGNPQSSFKSVHIAGTNGKGSTAHTLAAILQSAGYKTGLYTSPHLKNFTERIKINGVEIGEEEVVRFVDKIIPVIEEIHPSFFEVTVAMAFDIFAKEKIDIAIIETGLGGRLDSTNVILPEISLITNIGLDHQAILGETLEEIAFEKAGIAKPGVPLVISEYQEKVAQVFDSKSKAINAPLSYADKSYTVKTKNIPGDNLRVDIYENDALVIEDLALSLSGIYQIKNIPGILKTVDLLQEKGFSISQGNIREGFRDVKELTGLKGRWQIIQKSPLVVCDTGHNEAGISYVVQQLMSLNYDHLHMVLGVANDKKLEGIFAILPKDADYYFCQARIPRALDAYVLAEQAATFGLKGTVIPDINEAIKVAKTRARENDVIFVGGSSFVVAEIENL